MKRKFLMAVITFIYFIGNLSFELSLLTFCRVTFSLIFGFPFRTTQMLRLPKGGCLLLYLILLINNWVLYRGYF